MYGALDDDDLEEYGDYPSSWILDSGASGNYASFQSDTKNKRKVRRGISVGCANNHSMNQTGAGTLPFERIRPEAADVQLFESMQSPLLSTGKLSRDGGSTVVCDIPAATVLSGRTQNAVRRIITEAQQDPDNDDILMTVPFDPVSLTWRTVTSDGHASPRHKANNVHRIRSKKVLIDYYHRAAGFPMKKTWLAALHRGEYRDWPGLTPELVSKHLPQDTEETAAGHLQ